MNFLETIKNKKGGVGSGVLLWLIGVPLPIVIIISMMRSC